MTNNSDSSAPNSPELTRLSGEQAEERTAREGRKCPDCAGMGYDCVRRPMGGIGHHNVQCWTCKGTGLQPTCNRLVLTVGSHPPNHEYEVRCPLALNHAGKCEPSFNGAEPAATEITASENTHKDSACTSCSHLASRVEELEKLIAKHSGSLNSADSASNAESSSTSKEIREIK